MALNVSIITVLQQSRRVRKEEQASRTHRLSETEGELVAVEVDGHTTFGEPWRRDEHHVPGVHKRLDEGRIEGVNRAGMVVP